MQPEQRPLITPQNLLEEFPLSATAFETVQQARHNISQIFEGRDKRFLVIVGPCSIHDPKSAMEYAQQLKKIIKRFSHYLCVVMRVYFEKPRTTMGWKGFISDPFLDNSFDTNAGLRMARKLLLDINNLGVPAATEFLDTTIPVYLNDLISWTAIGARTSSSQIHRELASGLSMPVGFKNTIDGNIKIAVDAANVASHPHYYFSINQQGTPVVTRTSGNKNSHIILRGSEHAPNYHFSDVQHAIKLLNESNFPQRIIIDCSHGNSMKNYSQQKIVADTVTGYIHQNISAIKGVMIESNLVAGKQILNAHSPLVYGQSITDGCISWEETLPLLEQFACAIEESQLTLT